MVVGVSERMKDPWAGPYGAGGGAGRLQEAGSEAAKPLEQAGGSESRWIEYTVKPGDTLWELAVRPFQVRVEDLLRDDEIADPRRLQPVRKIQIRFPPHPREQELVASWYGRA